MMAYARKRLIHVFPGNLKIDESWKDVKELRTEHFLIFDSKNGLNLMPKLSPVHSRLLLFFHWAAFQTLASDLENPQDLFLSEATFV